MYVYTCVYTCVCVCVCIRIYIIYVTNLSVCLLYLPNRFQKQNLCGGGGRVAVRCYVPS